MATLATPRTRSPVIDVFLDEMLDDLLAEDPPPLAEEPTRTDASIGDVATWQRLVDLASEANRPRLADAFRAALMDELARR